MEQALAKWFDTTWWTIVYFCTAKSQDTGIYEAEMIKYSMGLIALENPWLGYIIRNGLIFLVVYVFLYFLTFKKLLEDYSKFDKLFVSVCFLLIASTNNSLDGSYIYLFYFMLLSIIFNPKLLGKEYYKTYFVN